MPLKIGSVDKSKYPNKGSTKLIMDPGFIDEIKSRLIEGKRIRRKLPNNGWLNIDRQLPFLIVYRQPQKEKDEGTRKLVRGEASYLIASGSGSQHSWLKRLVHTIVEAQVQLFGSSLIIEIWSTNITQVTPIDPNLNRPEFKIITSPTRPPTHTVEALEDALRRIMVNRMNSIVDITYAKYRNPYKLSPLISSLEARKLNCFVVGLQIGTMYRDQTTGVVFPLALRRLHMGLSSALKKAAFVFARKQTTMRPKHSEALGKRALVKAVWEIDRQLAEIDTMFNFLLLVTPINIDQAWTLFQRNKFEKVPAFYYRPRPVDPALLKRKLYQVPIEIVEDPVIANLLRGKRDEINRKLTMLEDRNLPQFFLGNLQLYGGISNELKSLAEEMLSRISPHSRNGLRKDFVNAETFAEIAEKEFQYYRQQYPMMTARPEIRSDIVGLMVVSGNLLIGKSSKIHVSRIDALIQHEIGTHVLTYFNGKSQPFRQLFCGLPGYEELQEGLAVLAEYLVGGLSKPRLRLLAGRVISSSLLIDGATFIETFRELNHTYGFTKRTAYNITVRTFRGGGLTKDAVYLRGLVQLLGYLQEGGALEPLFIGKIALEHIPVIQELQWRKVLKPFPLKPRYTNNEEFSQKLSILRNSGSVLNLIN